MPQMPNNLLDLRILFVGGKINQISSIAFSVKEIKHKTIGWKKHKILFAGKIHLIANQLSYLLFN